MRTTSTNWTARVRRSAIKNIEFENLFPDEQPAFVISWLYIVAVLAVASLIIVMASGMILALRGSLWYHTSDIGLFVNSLHFWSVEFFFLFIIVHLWGNFWRAAWRGHRFATWAMGVFAFLASIATAFTGYLVQTNFDAQWLAIQAKDPLNAVGVGGFFNTLNTGQTLLLHVSVLPAAIVVIVAWHIILVRRHGFASPIDAEEISEGAE
jgi:hypothetical protein